MKIIPTFIADLFVIEPQVIEDARGYFFEAYNQQLLEKAGIHLNFVQDNQSHSTYGVLRGLHFQKAPMAQTKLVRALEGTIFDVAVDCRRKSPTFGKWFGIELSVSNKKQLLIPKGFAHGFSVLSEKATVLYKCDQFYAPSYDAGFAYNDAELNIDWQLPPSKIILSAKDAKLPSFKNADINFD